MDPEWDSNLCPLIYGLSDHKTKNTTVTPLQYRDLLLIGDFIGIYNSSRFAL